MDDKEKYFDRLTMEYQCGAMVVAGCSKEGYVEMTAEDLHQRDVHIITDMGTVDAIFKCGLPQGSDTVCVRSNFIDRLEVAMWNLSLPPLPQHPPLDPPEHQPKSTTLQHCHQPLHHDATLTTDTSTTQ